EPNAKCASSTLKHAFGRRKERTRLNSEPTDGATRTGVSSIPEWTPVIISFPMFSTPPAHLRRALIEVRLFNNHESAAAWTEFSARKSHRPAARDRIEILPRRTEIDDHRRHQGGRGNNQDYLASLSGPKVPRRDRGGRFAP